MEQIVLDLDADNLEALLLYVTQIYSQTLRCVSITQISSRACKRTAMSGEGGLQNNCCVETQNS